MNALMPMVIAALVCGTTASSPDSTQEIQPSMAARLARHVGDNVRVIDAAGTTLSGTLWAVTADEIEVLTDGVARPVKFANTTRVERADGVTDGIVKGALFGVAHGMLALWMNEREYGPGLIAGAVIIDGLVGAIIDSLHTVWTPLYVREDKGQKVSAGSPRAAVTLRVRF